MIPVITVLYAIIGLFFAQDVVKAEGPPGPGLILSTAAMLLGTAIVWPLLLIARYLDRCRW